MITFNDIKREDFRNVRECYSQAFIFHINDGAIFVMAKSVVRLVSRICG